MKLSQKR